MQLAIFISEHIIQIIIFITGLFVLERIFRKQHHVITRNYRGRLTDASWQNGYSFVIGDGVVSPSYTNGMVVVLPKKFPQIYLDSSGDSEVYGPAENFNQSQRVSLEGNFDAYFHLYAPKGFEDLALSILAPDVMQTLISNANKFDVEIRDNELRLISVRSIIFDRKRQEDIKHAARAILTEVDHKLRTWSPQNQLPTLLAGTAENTIKVAHTYVLSVTNILFATVVVAVCTAAILITKG